jgi:hypothetical protein
MLTFPVRREAHERKVEMTDVNTSVGPDDRSIVVPPLETQSIPGRVQNALICFFLIHSGFDQISIF